MFTGEQSLKDDRVITLCIMSTACLGQPYVLTELTDSDKKYTVAITIQTQDVL